MRLSVLFLILFSAVSQAQPIELSQAMENIAGTEVSFSGKIGYFDDEERQLYIRYQDELFQSHLDDGREARKAISGCRISEWDEGFTCIAQGTAEVRFSGNELFLNIFSVQITRRTPNN